MCHHALVGSVQTPVVFLTAAGVWEKSLTSALEGCNLYLLVSRSWEGGGLAGDYLAQIWELWEGLELFLKFPRGTQPAAEELWAYGWSEVWG